MRAKTEGFSVEDDSFIDILHCSELIAPSPEMICEVVQRYGPTRVTLRAKTEGFSVEDNGFIEILHCPELIVPSPEMKCEVVQRH